MAEESVTAKKIQDKRSKIERAKETHARKTKERASDIGLLRAAYQSEKDGIVLADILSKIRAFANYHTKMAQDGVGARKTGHKLENGSDEMETVFYDHEKRITELDKAAGQLEVLDYIERQMKVEEK